MATTRPSATFPVLEHPGPLPFAHRGGASEVPENTMAAFQHAIDLGYRYLETDVHLTADGVLLAFHDDVLDRVTDRTGAIHELEWATIRAARVGGTEPIPRFDELLDAWPDVRVNIDPKHDRAVDALAASIERAGAVDRVIIGAFSDKRLARLRELLGPRLCTSLGPRNVAKLRAASYGVPVRGLPSPCVQVPVRHGSVTIVDDRFVRKAHQSGLQVHVWTIDDRDEMVRLLDLGVDGIMTDRPERLKDVLLSRGEWHGS
jgi:glycerophosphoryl diester phosphodiesterase